MTLIERLRRLEATEMTIDDLMELRMGASALQAQYTASAYDVPEWLMERIALLDRELASRRADRIRKRLKEIEAAELNLETAEEKRTRLREERERLVAALG